MSDVKYEYLYNEFDVLTHYSEAIRGDSYKLYKNLPLDYTFAQGEEREYFRKKESNNPLAGVGKKSTVSESPEHYNAKMIIVRSKKFYDTIFKKWIEFDNIIPEQKQENKKPDLSCYNLKGELIMCIEILYTHKKSYEDILELKKLNIPITEINIKDDNKCKHIVLPKILESNRGEFEIITNRIKQYKRNFSKELVELEEGVSNIKKQIEREGTYRIQKIKTWLRERSYSRININIEIGNQQTEINSYIKKTLQIIKDLREYSNRRKGNVNISKLNSEIERVESEIIEVKELIEINAFYSNPETNDFLYIN
jgi:hypothetical protein